MITIQNILDQTKSDNYIKVSESSYNSAIQMFKATEKTSLKSALRKANRDETAQGDTEAHEIKLTRVKNRSANDVTADLRTVITDVNVTKENDRAKLIFFFNTTTESNGNKHKQIVAFDISDVIELEKEKIEKWLKDLTYKKIQQKFTVEFFCDCESYKYHFSKINKTRGSFYIGTYNTDNLDYTVKGAGWSVNPRKLGGLCKHLMSCLEVVDQRFNTVKATLEAAVLDYIKNNEKKTDRLMKRVDKTKYENMTTSALKHELKNRGINYKSNDAKKKLISLLRLDDAEKSKNEKEDKLKEQRGSRERRKQQLEEEKLRKEEEKKAKELEIQERNDAREKEEQESKDRIEAKKLEDTKDEVKTEYDDMKTYQLKRELRKRKIKFLNNASKDELKLLLTEDDNNKVEEPKAKVSKPKKIRKPKYKKAPKAKDIVEDSVNDEIEDLKKGIKSLKELAKRKRRKKR